MIVIEPTESETNVELEELVSHAREGSREAAETLIKRLQPIVFNLCQKFYLHPEDGEDAAQEILIKALTNLGRWRSDRGPFRVWFLAVARNHLIDVRRQKGRLESQMTGLNDYFDAVDAIPDDVSADTLTPGPEARALAMEANASCMLGMLVCLDREQRLVLIVGDVLGIESREAAQIFGVTAAAFRQRLHRARAELYSFLERRCGLVNKGNPCRCRKKAKGFAAAGWIDPVKRTWTDSYYQNAEVFSEEHAERAFDGLYEACSAQFRGLPAYDSDRNLVDLTKILEAPNVKRWFRLESDG
jgi:RNA polymerase sigma factor (sigma-70 family)